MKSRKGIWTVDDLVAHYRKSRNFIDLSSSTKTNTMKAIKYLSPWRSTPLDEIRPSEMASVMDGLTPGNAHIFLSRARALFSYARRLGEMTSDPLSGLSAPKTGEYRPWTDKEYRRFLALGTPTTAMAIRMAFYTGQRLSDVLKMRWSDIDGSIIRVKQQKTGVELEIAIHPTLKKALDSHPVNGDVILTDENGNPFNIRSFRCKFARERKKLGLPPDLVFHGIRKLMACTMAEKGATPQAIMAVGGWKSLRQVSHYCKGANQRELAAKAMATLPS